MKTVLLTVDMTYSNLAWINLIILGILILPYLLKLLIKYKKPVSKSIHGKLMSSIKFFRKIHKPLALLLIIIAFIHGYLALGAIKLHTGLVLYISVLITASLGGAFYKFKKKIFFTWHKNFALITVILFLVHFFAPNAIFYLLN